MFLNYEWEEFERDSDGIAWQAVYVFSRFCAGWWAIILPPKLNRKAPTANELEGGSILETIKLCLMVWEWKGCYNRLGNPLLVPTTQDLDSWKTMRREHYFPEVLEMEMPPNENVSTRMFAHKILSNLILMLSLF